MAKTPCGKEQTSKNRRNKMDFVPWLVAGMVVFVFVVALLKSSFFTIHTKQAAIVERFGRIEF
jgi:hypothetical protein